MPGISLTDFVDIVSAAGTPKATKVKNVKNRPEYEPRFDYWKRLRDQIVDVHKNSYPKSELGNILPGITGNKRDNYMVLIDTYKSWWGRRTLSWFEPPHGTYSAHGVDVSVNPELGLEIKGSPHLVKLYFKAEPLAKNRVDIITHLMHKQLSRRCPNDTSMSILDIRRRKFISPTVPVTGLDAILDSELAYVANLWPAM